MGLERDRKYNGHGPREHFVDGGGKSGRQIAGITFAHLEFQ